VSVIDTFGGVLSAVQLGVDEAGVVVLNGDDDGVPEAAGAIGLVAVASHAMTGLKELRSLVGVDVQQRAGLTPLKALERLARAAPPARDAVAPEHAVDGRAMAADERRQSHRPPVRPSAGIEDALLLDLAEYPRTRPRDRPPRRIPHAAGALRLGCPLPTIARRRDGRR